MKTFFREVMITIILAVVIFILLQTSVQSFVVVGRSMEPNHLACRGLAAGRCRQLA